LFLDEGAKKPRRAERAICWVLAEAPRKFTTFHRSVMRLLPEHWRQLFPAVLPEDGKAHNKFVSRALLDSVADSLGRAVRLETVTELWNRQAELRYVIARCAGLIGCRLVALAR
jgi:hypothetical protein